MIVRDAKITVRCTLEERRMLYIFAEVQGLTASDVLRLYIRKIYSEYVGSCHQNAPITTR